MGRVVTRRSGTRHEEALSSAIVARGNADAKSARRCFRLLARALPVAARVRAWACGWEQGGTPHPPRGPPPGGGEGSEAPWGGRVG